MYSWTGVLSKQCIQVYKKQTSPKLLEKKQETAEITAGGIDAIIKVIIISHPTLSHLPLV